MDMTHKKCGVLGLIPARGGSKRLPRKNLLTLVGQPLISYTIQAGLQANCIDELMVSTDDHEIAQVALAWGARVPFMRPCELARDDTSTFEVVRHALDYYKEVEGKLFEYVALLQPTSPLRSGEDIDNAMVFLRKKNADSVISVSELDHSPLWCNTLPDDLSMRTFLREDVKYKRSQELETYYRLNGAIYLCRTVQLLKEQTFFLKDHVYAHVMAREKSIDIDTSLELKLCEILLAEQLSGDNAFEKHQ
ncbi:acylneuraminate cytidylyltransferase family protein [Trichlorobacter lovleyi]|uniref:Acylneuraminate cytidylyltransferase n=1 Tax=Trichlorobacter lovleyi (strain ATCC BAA-1151 / DSM 17278 / SZ) TaxID=398767 RepID=B3E202_TRIL1|nr:acylneuraminate cytidylyltransferase family protein [Trichlorobacter lovleyi]ACD97105.1 acylneuraminate cytidylyltransferase [Trichlorobacter lovleyi SZ]